VAADELRFPNGTVITPDGRTLIVAESVGLTLTAFDIAADGSLSGRREWASFGSPVAPDGICLDAEGAIWVADAAFRRAVRVRAGGEIVDEVFAGEMGVFACMLGGHDGRTLFLCAAPSFLEAERNGARDGQLLAARVDVPHAGLP
jgi:sugar lactone lactonase YvrE